MTGRDGRLSNDAAFYEMAWMAWIDWQMLSTKAVPGTAVAFVRVVALLTPWDYQGVIHPIGVSLFTSRENLSVCVMIFRSPCTR